MKDPPTASQRENSGNTTHGSGWIVQARPTKRAARPFVFCYISLSPRAARGERGKPGIPGVPLVGSDLIEVIQDL